jgi:hypothetical protein
MPGSAPVNVGDPELEYALYEAERRVRGIQAKLHRCEVPRTSRTGDPLGSFSEKVRARASESTEVLPRVQG